MLLSFPEILQFTHPIINVILIESVHFALYIKIMLQLFCLSDNYGHVESLAMRFMVWKQYEAEELQIEKDLPLDWN